MGVKKTLIRQSWWIFAASVILVLVIHYFVFAPLNIHPTIQVVIGLILSMIISSLMAILVKKFF